jgi:hypothetical protein
VRYTFTLCRASGEPVADALDAKERRLVFQRNGAHSATVKVPLSSAFAAGVQPGLSRLKVWRERSADELALDPGLTSVLEFYGSLPAENVTIDPASDELEAVFLDPRWVLGRRYSLGTETFSADDQGDILWSLVNTQNARTGGDTWIRQGGTTTGVTRDRTYDRQVVSQLFEDMTKVLDGCDVDIDPRDDYPTSREMGDLRAYAEQGSEVDAHFSYGPDLVTNCRNIGVTFLPITTYATVTGAADGAAVPLTSSFGSPTDTGFGLLENYSSDPDVSVQATVDAKARGIVVERQGLRPVFTIEEPTVEAPRALEDYYLGDTVLVSVAKGAVAYYSQPARIDTIELSISQEGHESAKVTLAVPAA